MISFWVVSFFKMIVLLISLIPVFSCCHTRVISFRSCCLLFGELNPVESNNNNVVEGFTFIQCYHPHGGFTCHITPAVFFI